MLTYGYIDEQLKAHNIFTNDNKKYPMELVKIIAMFAGNVLFRFDTTNELFTNRITSNGFTIKNTQLTKINYNEESERIFCCIGSSFDISNPSNNVTEVKIKVIKSAPGDYIGVIADIEECKTQNHTAAHKCFVMNGY